MADTNAQADIRGIDIDKLAKGFADEEIVLKKYITITPTSAREIRWYQKTSGFLDSTDTSDITASQIANTSFKARPFIVEQSWTRNTSYVRKYFVESPLLSDEDIKDSDIDILATNVRDLVRAVAHQVDKRIWDVLTEEQSANDINEVSINHEWDDHTNCTPITDLMEAKKKIREQGYDPEGAILMLNPEDHRQLLAYLIEQKGSSIPGFSSERIKDGIAMEILGLRVVVNTIVTDDYACVFVPNRAVTWKQFLPTTSAIIEDKGIGTKIRVWEEGEALLTDPKAVCLLSNTNS
jgi:hypothetical protein